MIFWPRRCAAPSQNASSRSSAGSSAAPLWTNAASPRTAAKAKIRADFGSTSRSIATQVAKKGAVSKVKRQASEFQGPTRASKPLITLSPRFDSLRFQPRVAFRFWKVLRAAPLQHERSEILTAISGCVFSLDCQSKPKAGWMRIWPVRRSDAPCPAHRLFQKPPPVRVSCPTRPTSHHGRYATATLSRR